MVKITVFREDNQPVLHLQRRQSTSASYFGKTIVLVLKKTILLEKTILPFPTYCQYFVSFAYFKKSYSTDDTERFTRYRDLFLKYMLKSRVQRITRGVPRSIYGCKLNRRLSMTSFDKKVSHILPCSTYSWVPNKRVGWEKNLKMLIEWTRLFGTQ